MGRVQLFIVRIDRDAPGFRASARRVDEDVTGQFDQPQMLLEFLVGALARPAEEPARGVPDANDDPS